MHFLKFTSIDLTTKEALASLKWIVGFTKYIPNDNLLFRHFFQCFCPQIYENLLVLYKSIMDVDDYMNQFSMWECKDALINIFFEINTL